MENSSYFESLEAKAKGSYCEKLSCVGLSIQDDPYLPKNDAGRGYSTVVLDRFQACPAHRHFSVPECWAGGGNEATLVSRGHLSSCLSSTPCFLLCPGLTQPALYLFCCFNSVPGALSRSILRFSLRLLRCAWFTSRTQLCHIDDRPPKLHFENFNINYPLDLL